MARALRSDINITPLIDIVLVLLIVFIVLVPVLDHAHKAVLPTASRPDSSAAMPLVLTLLPGGAMQLQQETLQAEPLVARLAESFAGMDGKARKVVLKVDGRRPFRDTVHAMDLVRTASDRVKRPGDDDARVTVSATQAP
jgi:biopolymer transport protein ExbD